MLGCVWLGVAVVGGVVCMGRVFWVLFEVCGGTTKIMMKHDKYKTNSYGLFLTLQCGVNKSKEVEKVDFWRGPEMIQ